MRILILCLITIAFHLTCYAQQSGAPLFTSMSAAQTNIRFSNDIRDDNTTNILAYEYFYNGGGVAVGDINNDGLPDIFFTANMKTGKLYLNQGNLQFKDITKSSKTGGRKDWKTGVTMADVNGDGWLDIYVCYSGKGSSDSRRNELYINNHDLTFTESAAKYGLDDPGCSTQAIFFDYDLDGDLDCYVLNHNIKAFKNVDAYLKTEYDSLAADRLYRNDNGKFVDISKEAGISGNPISFGLGVAVSDINNDGWPDIYVSNDYTEQDYCYINNRNGTFSQRELYMFGHLSEFSMGCDIADMNNDGLVDIMTLDMLPEENRRQKLLQGQENYELYQDMATNGFHYQFMRNMLQLNNGNGTFSEIGQLAGISNTDWSWAPLFADLDNDGNKDLFITTGYLRDYTNKDFLKYWGDYLVKQIVHKDSIKYMDIIKLMPVTLLPNYAFKNNGDLTFQNVSQKWGLQQRSLSSGAAYADLDNDGDLDLVVNNVNRQASIYRNETGKTDSSHFLKIQLRGSDKNTFGLGAKLWCYTKGKTQFLEQMPTRGYQSSVSEILHFGLGRYVIADTLKIKWLSGESQVLYNIKGDQLITLEEKNANDSSNETTPAVKKYFAYQKPLVDYTHFQLEYNDFKRQPLIPVMLSQCGPKFKTGDLNNDGLEDVFIGGSQGQSSELFLQQPGGSFAQHPDAAFMADSISTTAGVVFFDADNDNDLDIYATSGGYNDYAENDARLEDRLFLNDGKGNFTKATGALPKMISGKSVVAVADVDGDGDMDLFVGGRVIPGQYPRAPRSFLLLNDGKGKFTDATEAWLDSMGTKGMITDAKWIDINNDKRPDLVITGEWMAPTVLLNTGKKLQETNMGLKGYSGWWNTIEFFDADHDGDMDMIAGNWGLNSQIKASEKEPAEMIWKDFDNNGSIDPFLCYYINGRSYPFVSRDELLDEIYPLRRKFTSYKSYADATLEDIFGEEELKEASRLKATHLATTYFENVNGHFIEKALPVQAQFSPVYKIVVHDWNKDGFDDLLLLGNNEYPRLKIGKMDANFGTVLLNDGKGDFHFIPNKEAGLLLAGDVKDAAIIQVKGDPYLLIGINDGALVNFKLMQ
ncbi:MAG: VCBS repeat-containing protein [Ginsengibacter sp.]